MFDLSSPIKHLAEFKRLLKNYNPNLELLDLITKYPFVLLAAPTAAGRNTIVKNLIMTGRYYYVISDTTRHPRINNGIPEKNGNEYWFKSEEEFLRDLRRNNYIEAAIIHNQQVSGINVQELRHASQTGAIPITDVDIQGCDTIMSVMDKAIPIFILPPDFPEWMSRLDGRGAMDKSEKIRRLTSATNEIDLALQRSYFKFMVNYDLRLTIETLHEHIISGQFGELEQSNARTHAQKLLTDLDKYLQ